MNRTMASFLFQNCRRAAVLLVLLSATTALQALACSEDDDTIGNLFVVRKYDEVVLKDGTVIRGKVNEQDDGNVSVTSSTGVKRVIAKDQIREIRYAATKESELERLSKEAASNPAKMFCVAREATTRFNLHAKVIPILENFISAHPDEPLMRLLAGLYLKAGKNDLALKIADKLVAAGKPKPRSLMIRAQALGALDRLEEAEKDMLKAYKELPNDTQVVLAYAELLLKLGRADEAKKSFAELIGSNPRNFKALTGLGNVQIRVGDFAGALLTFQQALGINENYLDARIGLAMAELMSKQYEPSFDDAVKALNIDNNSAEAMAIQAFCMAFKADPASLAHIDEKNYIKDSLEAKPNQPRLRLAEYVKLERQARYEELRPEKERNAGLVLQMKAAATAKLNEVLASDAADSYIQFFIAERRFRESDEARRRNDATTEATALTKAEDAYRRCIKLSPSYAPAQSGLGATLLRRKKFPEAKAAFAKAAELDKSAENADALAGQGLAMLTSEKFEEASKLLDQALALDPNNVAALCGRGYIANWERDKERAKTNFEKALAADGDCTYAANALQLIYKQDDREMEYVRFPGPEMPKEWRVFSPGTLKWSTNNGQAVLAGTQTNAMGTRVELMRTFPAAGKFERVEADLGISPTTAASFGLRLASGAGNNAAFEFEFGKDETGGDLKLRFRDNVVNAPTWTNTRVQWPTTGRVRLGIWTDGLKPGACTFKVSVNGKAVAEVPVTFQQPPKVLSIGVFLQAQPKENILATVNNVAIVKKGVTEPDKEVNTGDIKLLGDPPANPEKKPEEKKPDDKKPEEKGK